MVSNCPTYSPFTSPLRNSIGLFRQFANRKSMFDLCLLSKFNKLSKILFIMVSFNKLFFFFFSYKKKIDFFVILCWKYFTIWKQSIVCLWEFYGLFPTEENGDKGTLRKRRRQKGDN